MDNPASIAHMGDAGKIHERGRPHPDGRHPAPPGVSLALLGNRRDVLVYLPPGYRRSRRRYPVLYMHDGQNVFDAATSFTGVEWGIDETSNG